MWSRTGPGRWLNSNAADAKKQPPGNTCRSEYPIMWSQSAQTRAIPLGASRAGAMTSSTNTEAA